MPTQYSRQRLERLPAIVMVATLLVALLPASALAAPDHPDFATEPAGALAGQPFTTQPVVSIVKGNSVDSSATGTITLSISSNPGAGMLTCTGGLSKVLSGGMASFLGCSINVAGNGYSLLATWSQGGSASSATFDVAGTNDAGTKLGFTAQPARGRPGVAFAVQPVVAVQDVNGTTVTSSTASVTLALGANPGGGALSCSGGLTKSAVSGIAGFSACSITAVGVGYTIVATSSGLTQATSSPFDVADRLVFSAQPSGAMGGTAFTTQPVVAVRAGATNTATHDQTTQVTLAIKAGTGAAGAVLTCTNGLIRTVVSGLATFAGCMIDKVSPTSPANPYQLVATATGLTSATSATLAVTVGPPAKLAFTAQPGTSTAGLALVPQPIVAIQDAGGNPVTSGTGSTATVTLAIGTNPGGGVLTCTGGLSKAAVAGVATFSGCAISAGGTGCTLVASSTGLTSATSLPFNVIGSSRIVVTPSASVINYLSSVSFSIHIDSLGTPRVLQLQVSRDRVNWTALTSLSTSAGGDAAFTYAPSTNFYYRASFAGAPGLGVGVSPSVRVVVRQSVALRPNAGVIRLVNHGTRIAYTATIQPLPLSGQARVSFLIYKRVGGVWLFRTSATLPANGAGVATFAWTWGRGEWYIRARANATAYDAARLSTIARIVAR